MSWDLISVFSVSLLQPSVTFDSYKWSIVNLFIPGTDTRMHWLQENASRVRAAKCLGISSVDVLMAVRTSGRTYNSGCLQWIQRNLGWICYPLLIMANVYARAFMVLEEKKKYTQTWFQISNSLSLSLWYKNRCRQGRVEMGAVSVKPTVYGFSVVLPICEEGASTCERHLLFRFGISKGRARHVDVLIIVITC